MSFGRSETGGETWLLNDLYIKWKCVRKNEKTINHHLRIIPSGKHFTSLVRIASFLYSVTSVAGVDNGWSCYVS
jgi:hypothetical protein